jgi:hypothetical protein
VYVAAVSGSAGAGDVVVYADTGATATADDAFTYLTAGEIESITPSQGQYGTAVTVVGSRLRGGGAEVESVRLGDVAAISITQENDTVVVAVAPAADAGDDATSVSVIADTGAITTGEDLWTYIEAGAISSVFPFSGQGGTFVEIRGARLHGGGNEIVAVTLVGVEAAISLSNDSFVVVEAGASNDTGEGDVVLISDTGAITTQESGFEYLDAGEITSLSPERGQAGTVVTIAGTNLFGGGSSFVLVKVGGEHILDLIAESDTEVIVRAAVATDASTTSVELISNSGARTVREDVWSYESASSIDAIAPSSGQAGTSVEISGSNLLGIGGTEIVLVTLASVEAVVTNGTLSTAVTATVAANNGSASTGDVYIRSDSGAIAVLEGGWQYLEAGVIDSVSPDSGQAGTLVTVTGDRLLGGGDAHVAANFGSASASITKTSDTEVIVVLDAGDPGTVDVSVVADSGATVTSTNAFTYITAGEIDGVTPNVGHHGTLVTIAGSSLRGGGSKIEGVSLAGTDAVDISVESDLLAIVTAGASDDALTGDVVVISDTGSTVTLVDGFRYLTPGSVDSVSPDEGVEGTFVTILGSGMLGGGESVASVHIVGANATILSGNDTLIVVQATAGETSQTTGDVVIVSDTGATVTSEDAFTVLNEPQIFSVTPDNGRVATQVTIVGSLCGGGTSIVSVGLAGVEAVISEQDCSEVVVRASDTDNTGVGDVVLVADTGAVATRDDGFTYIADGSIDSVEPSAGQAGITITITGTNMLGSGSEKPQVSLVGVGAFVQSFSQTEIILLALSDAERSTSGPGDVIITGSTGDVTRAAGAFTYSEILSVTPDTGQRGTRITIAGNALLAGATNVTDVRLSIADAEEIVSFSETEVVATLAAVNVNRDSLQSITIVMDDDATVAAEDVFTYRPASSIDSVSPPTGQAGTVVVLTGTNLLGYGSSIESVTIAGVAAEILLQNDTYVSIVAGDRDAGTGDIVLVADTGANIVLADGTAGLENDVWEYAAKPEIEAVTPSAGQVNSVVTITGSALRGAGNEIVGVTLGGIAVSSIVSESDAAVVVVASAYVYSGCSNDEYNHENSCVAECPDGLYQSGSSDLDRICLPCHASCDTCTGGDSDECSSCPDSLLLVDGACTSYCLESADPLFRDGGTCNSCHANCTECTGSANTECIVCAGDLVLHGRSCIAQCPEGMFSDDGVCKSCHKDCNVCTQADYCLDVVGPLEVAMVADSGATVSAADAWSYNPSGRIVSAAPASGQVGTQVVIEGFSLKCSGDNVSEASIAGVAAEVISETDTQVVIVAGNASAGAADIVLTSTGGGTVTLESGFTYLAAGEIDQVIPNSGQIGTRVAINGTNLLGGGSAVGAVTVGGVTVAEVLSATNTVVEVVLAAADAGAADVQIVSDSGSTVTATAGFTYLTPSEIESVAPESGQEGTTVTITGSNLRGGGDAIVAVALAGVAVGSLEGENNTHVVVSAAAGSAGAGDVVLTADTGATTTLEDGFEYATAGEITAVEPGTGQAGTAVTISGSGLLGGGSSIVAVTLAGSDATIGSHNDTHLYIVAGESEPGVGDVIITSDSGATIALGDGFEYIVAGNITSVAPATGRLGTRVVIKGTGLLGGGSTIVGARFAGVSATSVDSSSDTEVQVTVAAGPAGPGSVELTSDTGATVVAPYEACD